MSTWYLNKKHGLSLNEGGGFFTLAFIKLNNDDRGNWMFRIFFYIPKFMKRKYIFVAFLTLHKIIMKKF